MLNSSERMRSVQAASIIECASYNNVIILLHIAVLKSLDDQNTGYAEYTKFFEEFRWKIWQIFRLSDSKEVGFLT